MRLLCGLAFALSIEAQFDNRALLRRAESDLQNGRYPAAIAQAAAAAKEFETSTERKDYARALTVGALAQMYSGAYGPAIRDFEKALAIARKTHEFGSEIARLNDIGNAFYFQGRYTQALDRYQEAMRRVGAVPGDKWSSWGRQFSTANIAILYQTLGQFDRALKLYDDLLASEQSLKPEERAQLLANVGVLRRRMGDPQKALETYRDAQALYRGGANRDGEIALMNNIGIVQAMDFQDLAAAESTFSTALALATQSGDRPLMVHARLYRGETLYRDGRMAQSLADFEAAAALAKQLGEREEEWKALYGMARIRLAQGQGEAARALLKSAVNVIESLRTGVGPPLIRSTFLAGKRAVYDLLIENTSAIDEVFQWMEASRARTFRERLHAGPRLTLAQVAAKLPRDTALLEYWMGEKSAAVLWIAVGHIGIRRWHPGAAEADNLATARVVLADPARRDWRPVLQRVARAILAGIPPLNDGQITQLRVIPDGALAQIPFEALPLSDDALLVDRFAVTYQPAGDLPVSKRVGARERWPWERSIAAFADPRGGWMDGAGLTLSQTWSPLPEASREVAGAAAVLGGKALLHLHEDARRQWLSAAAQCPILHFATHALADAQNPELSYILLAPASAGYPFDSLYLNEVYELPLTHVDLVVLSACDTNVGRYIGGEGIQGFSQAFLAAGARAVVTSLWSVGDKSTREFMLLFYRQMAGGVSVATALQRTKRKFLKYPQSAHPIHWAAFTVAGDGEYRMPVLIGWTWIVGVPALVLAFLFVLRRLKARA